MIATALIVLLAIGAVYVADRSNKNDQRKVCAAYQFEWAGNPLPSFCK